MTVYARKIIDKLKCEIKQHLRKAEFHAYEASLQIPNYNELVKSRVSINNAMQCIVKFENEVYCEAGKYPPLFGGEE